MVAGAGDCGVIFFARVLSTQYSLLIADSLPPMHISIHPCPANATPGPSALIDGRQLLTCLVPADWAAATLPRTFDEAIALLSELPRMFVEPDGSFVWVGGDGSALPEIDAWQIDGLLYDQGPRLSHAEIKGICPPVEMARLFDAIGGDPRGLMVQAVQEGVFFEATVWLGAG